MRTRTGSRLRNTSAPRSTRPQLLRPTPDIYAGGRSEEVFADLVRESGVSRDKLILQSKCGIVPGKMYDFSKKHILESVDGILKRLNTDYLDVLLLHRPDALMEPEEIAEAFDTLEAAGKVRHFGVSNEDPNTLALLQKYVRQPIAADQLQLSVTNASMIEQPMNMNIGDDRNLDRDNGVLNYCRLHDITIQTWSPFQYGFMEGVFLGNEKFAALTRCSRRSARATASSSTTIPSRGSCATRRRCRPLSARSTRSASRMRQGRRNRAFARGLVRDLPRRRPPPAVSRARPPSKRPSARCGLRRRTAAVTRVTNRPLSGPEGETPVLAQAKRELCEYFAGARKTFTVPLNPAGTDFQRAVWAALRAIPYGETRTYGAVAAAVGRPKAARAVGNANNKNPF